MELENILTKPYKVPKSIKDSIFHATNSESRPLAIFVGAGVSRICGCSSWKAMADKLVDLCVKHESNLISYRTGEYLYKENDKKKVITICKNLLKDYENQFWEVIGECLEPDKEKNNRFNTYSSLRNLNPNGLFLTTNIDNLFTRVFETGDKSNRIFSNVKEKDKPEKDSLYHLHGSFDRSPKEVVLTVDQYLKCYRDEGRFNNFLSSIFKDYSVLFLGYGLEEFEILDFLMRSIGENEKEKPHSILLPFLKGEEDIIKAQSSYYSELGIELIAYFIDDSGFEELKNIIDDWLKEISIDPRYDYVFKKQSFNISDELLSGIEDKEIFKAKYKSIRGENALKNFYEKLSIEKSAIDYLEPLFELNAFKIENSLMANNENGLKRYVLPYLKAVAIQFKKNPKDEYCNALRNIINQFTKFDFNNKQQNYLINEVILNLIFSLPKNFIDEKDINFLIFCIEDKHFSERFISNALYEYIVPSLIEHSMFDSLLKIIEKIANPVINLNDEIVDSLVIDNYYFQKIYEDYSEGISKTLGLDGINIVAKAILKRIDFGEDFNYINIPDLNDKNDALYKNEILIIQLMVKLLYFTNLSEEFNKTLLDFWNDNSDYLIFKRIFLHIVNLRFFELKNLFFNLNENPLKYFPCKYELYTLFENNCLSFTENEVSQIINWINEIDTFEKDIDKVRLAYQKKEWLNSLLKTNLKQVTNEFNKQNQINSIEIENPGKIFSIKFTSGNKSPLSFQQIKSMNHMKRIEYLNEFDDTNRRFEDGSKEGLADVLGEVIFEELVSLENEIHLYKDLDYIYLWGIMRSFKGAKNIFNYDYKQIFKFIEDAVGDSRLIETIKMGDLKFNYAEYFLSAIIDYFRSIFSNDKLSLNNNDLKLIEKVTLEIGEITPNAECRDYKDLINFVINTTHGKLLEFLILDFYPYTSKKNFINWSERMITLIESSLKNNLVEAYVTLARYITEIDKDWLNNEYTKIFDFEKKELWEAAITGFLAGYMRPPDNVHYFLKNNGHYKRAIDIDFEEQRFANQMLVTQICLAYIDGLDDILKDDSLISYLIEKQKPIHMSIIVNKAIEALSNQAISEKLMILLDKVFHKLKLNDQDDKEIIIAKTGFINSLSKVDVINKQILNWCLFSAKYISEFNSYRIIDNLLTHTKRSPSEVSLIFFELANNGVCPGVSSEFYRSQVTELAERLLEENQIENVKKIAEIYLDTRGSTIIKSVIDKYETQNIK